MLCYFYSILSGYFDTAYMMRERERVSIASSPVVCLVMFSECFVQLDDLNDEGERREFGIRGL